MDNKKFDQWRERYNEMSMEEQVAYHNDIEKHYPDQAHYNLGWAIEAIKEAKRGEDPPLAKVLEFGAWKGDMAQELIPMLKTQLWVAVEICENAIQKTHCNQAGFSYFKPNQFDWWNSNKARSVLHTIKPDIIVATHFIEHLSNQHFEELIGFCQTVPAIYFEAPLTDEGNTWEGYLGTHKLEYGWNQISELLSRYGYSLIKDFGQGKLYKK